MTHWRDEGGYIDVETSIQVHEAIEREFGIDVKDRHVLISDIEQAFHIVMQHHDSVWLDWWYMWQIYVAILLGSSFS